MFAVSSCAQVPLPSTRLAADTTYGTGTTLRVAVLAAGRNKGAGNVTRLVRFGVAAAVLAAAGCGGSGSGGGTGAQVPASSSGQASISIVALGDSDATGAGDTTGRGWVGRYGDLVERKLDRKVTVENHAVEGKTSDELLSEVTHDDSLRHALSRADVILIGIGGADLNAGDDALSAGLCKGRQCYVKPLHAFDVNIKAIAHQVRLVAPTALLRSITLPNVVPGGGKEIPSFVTVGISRYQVLAQRASTCQAMRSNGGRCADAVLAFNGPNASGDAYARELVTNDPCCYPSAKGQQLMAQLLVATGLPGRQGAQ